MGSLILFLVLFALVNLPKSSFCNDRGFQIRLTKKAMDYALSVEINKLQENLRSKTFDQSGSSGHVDFGVSNMRVTDVQFPRHSLSPITGQGVQVKVDGASIRVSGTGKYKYKRGWVRISDTIGVTVHARNIQFQMVVNFGADSSGRPTINTVSCRGDVGDVDVDFHGGISWIYNLFSGIVESKLKDSMRKAICDSAVKGINDNAKKSLATFPISKKIDKWAIIDYRLTSNPVFTSQYMDVFIKGEFKDASNPKDSKIPFTKFLTNQDSSKMIYFWISEYTLNTACEVYHDTGRLAVDVNGWDSKDPEHIRGPLNTKNIKILIPSIYKKYPDLPIGIHMTSYKKPYVRIQKTGIAFYIFARALLSVKIKDKIIPVFGINFSISASLSVEIKDQKVVLKINGKDFKYFADVDAQYRKIVNIPLNSRFIYGVLRTMIMVKVNAKLENGLALPSLDDIDLKDFNIVLQKGVLGIGSNIVLKK